MLRAAKERRIKCLWVFYHDLLGSAWPENETLEALLNLECLIFQGTNENGVSRHSHVIFPSAAYVEREGSFTNFEGRVQRFRKALEPLGDALPDWEILSRLARALGLDLNPTRSEDLFKALSQTIPAFAGLSYRSVGDSGQKVSP